MTQKHVMIVDDAREIRQAVRTLLEMEGHSVTEAKHGQEALSVLASGVNSPDLILLDLMMPVMDGRAFLSEIRKNDDYLPFRDIPIVVITAAKDTAASEFHRHLAKPFDADLLLETVVKNAR